MKKSMIMRAPSMVLLLLVLLLALVINPAVGQDDHHEAPPEVHHHEEQHQEQQHHEEQHQEQQQCEPCHCPTDELDRLRQDHQQAVGTSERCVVNVEQLQTQRGELQGQLQTMEQEHQLQVTLLKQTSERELQEATASQADEKAVWADEKAAWADKEAAWANKEAKLTKYLDASNKNLRGKEKSLEETKDRARQATKELTEAQDSLRDIEAAKTIVSIDWELLQQHGDEFKGNMQVHSESAIAFTKQMWHSTEDKAQEVWTQLQTEVLPKVQTFIQEDAIPFWKSAVQQATEQWETLYGPYRKPVNDKIKEVRKSANTQYKTHLEPRVKEYKLDEHAAKAQEQLQVAKKQGELYAAQGHEGLVKAVKSSSRIALDYVKLQEGPAAIAESLKQIHKDPETFASYAEMAVGLILLYLVYKLLFGGRSQKKQSGKKTKKQPAANGAASNGNGNKAVTFKNKNKQVGGNAKKGGNKKKMY